MSQPSVIFLASRQEASAPQLVAHGPRPPTPLFECAGLEPLKMATLLTLCSGGNVRDHAAVAARCPKVVADGGPQGPWVFPFPAELANLLAALDADRRRHVASRWARTDEWSIPAEETAQFCAWFSDLCDFITSHRGAPAEMWVWLAL